ncbi:MBL fold metallo-hydrolase [Aliidiomarina halalkaliphila]|uniref:MBL fold metallo-hydrolase n=1 Tax=Aliidiomarina halalkaliphila TaxID=2593535 RepID=A0A552X6A0_9GAMM|nr:MBL fold metallo-hydrolase [Aliidiomarina halalkaliphila]TRW50536.1 MBL fold metallo-hydrolase [Aliidiomarina halalkaliphila]
MREQITAIEFESFCVQPFLDNDSETFSYVVYERHGNAAVIIDSVLDFDAASGHTRTAGADRILRFIREHDLDVAHILETHAHADHLSAAPYLQKHTGAPIGIGAYIRDVQAIFKDVFNFEKEFLPNGAQFDTLLQEGEYIRAGGLQFEVIHCPGHTPADCAYLLNGSALFVGDTLFMPDVGTARCDFPGGSSNTLYHSIRKLLSYPEDTSLFVCHDYPPETREHACCTTVAEQRASNIHINDNVSEAEFVAMRDKRDATLAMPRLIIPAVQVNIRAGHFPPAEDNGVTYLKIPINHLR